MDPTGRDDWPRLNPFATGIRGRCPRCGQGHLFQGFLRYQASVWTHLMVTLPFGLVTCILPLRSLKGWLVASQYAFKAGEGRLWREGDG